MMQKQQDKTDSNLCKTALALVTEQIKPSLMPDSIEQYVQN